MTPTHNYSAYFQAQLRYKPRETPKPTLEKAKVTIRYKRTWITEQ